jgi:hypothetical protein
MNNTDDTARQWVAFQYDLIARIYFKAETLEQVRKMIEDSEIISDY